MRSVVFVSALCALGWLGAGCESGEKSTAMATYECPSCKDTVTWTYGTGPTKGISTGKKTVAHTCSMCKQGWVAEVSSSNQCAMCNAKEEKCPTCMAHGG
jgi:hypothetical protein